MASRTKPRQARRQSARQGPPSGLWRRGKWWFISGGVVAAIVLLVVLTPALSGTQKAVGNIAPDITLATAAGEFQLSERRGEALLLYFSFPGGPTCALEAPALARIQSEYRDKGLTVVAVNIQPSYSLEEWEGFWKGTGAGDVLWAQDRLSSTIRKYELVALGTEVLVDRQGLVAFRRDGPAGYGKLRSEIEKVLGPSGLSFLGCRSAGGSFHGIHHSR